ncbi:MAG: prepilin-type N-terminal cleavage/methylation domain-containing protein [Pirellulales bacterium]|nr:prepilin-type N-terminal cleavage/methylation domain-containing protein [Pirellulales bacterium]
MDRVALSRRTGFTLVELLVVIVIIGILTALVSVAVMGALAAARRAVIKQEIDGLHGACESYKAKRGAYPPSNCRDLAAHLVSVFPNMDANERRIVNELSQQTFTPAEILVFCLSGYGKNVRRPISTKFVDPLEPDYAFDKSRIRLTRTINLPSMPSGIQFQLAEYTAPHTNGSPFLYFDINRKSKLDQSPLKNALDNERYVATGGNGSGFCKAYVDATTIPNNIVPINPETFQIVSAGLDGDFGTDSGAGTYKGYPNGTNYSPADLDNITNFGTGTLGDAKP